MLKKTKKNEERLRRHARVRRVVSGTPDCPRLNVYRSNKQIYAQVIDDTTGRTLAASSSLLLKLENGIVTSLVSKEEAEASEIEDLVEKKFGGSLPAFVAAFTKHQAISESDLDEMQRMIDRIRRGESK